MRVCFKNFGNEAALRHSSRDAFKGQTLAPPGTSFSLTSLYKIDTHTLGKRAFKHIRHSWFHAQDQWFENTQQFSQRLPAWIELQTFGHNYCTKSQKFRGFFCFFSASVAFRNVTLNPLHSEWTAFDRSNSPDQIVQKLLPRKLGSVHGKQHWYSHKSLKAV